ncbi:type I-E CRISPR-associated protein Cse2/CasB [Inmirania thermothiophila]|uniref:CRISPR system Cascade subunit CasB n=1 Tax=Inmirania thermothiophila TaxID=1750597 RepID=A0A3N1Y1L6_9GAMM|nr:type I-E CRISPR-associated protein Cse2/CasB [Inmirania thermothiophila]ROR32700.1 CRISPR system Cascade subunit CasB [Inmirania thermothiophila]
MNASPEDLAHIIAHVAGTLASEHFPTGERAALRRMSPGQPPPLYFYRFALRHLPGNWEAVEADWVTLTAGMALMAPNAHRPGFSLGTALGEAGYSEGRMERLLQSDGDTRRILFLRAVRFLAAKAQPFDWLDGARLLLTRDAKKREGVHRRIARDFYTLVDQQKKSA